MFVNSISLKSLINLLLFAFLFENLSHFLAVIELILLFEFVNFNILYAKSIIFVFDEEPKL